MGRSKLNARGQISVPVEVRRRMGVSRGSVLEWHPEGQDIVVRRSGQYNWEDVHSAIFPDQPPKPRTLAELKKGIRQYVVERRAHR